MPDPDFPERLGGFHEPPRRRPRRHAGRIVAGVLAAVLLGAVAGLIMRPDLLTDRPEHQPSARDVEIPRRPDDLAELLPPILPPLPEPRDEEGELEEPPEPPDIDPEPEPAPEPEPEEVEEPEPEPEPDPPRRPEPPEPAPVPTPRLTVNCAAAGSTAERLVCIDPRLRSLDRQMADAYRRALASGAPPRLLRDQHYAWRRAREEAAHYGPEDLAGVYHARIAELRAMTR